MQVATTDVFIEGMDFDPCTGKLWASSLDQLYTIDLPSGTSTLVGATGLGVEIPDIVFDGRGNLFGLSGGSTATNNLISINPITGAGTLIGSMGTSSVQALAMLPYTSIMKPCAISFGNINVGLSKIDSVTVTNPGAGAFTIFSVASDNSEFTVTPAVTLPQIIQPFQSLKFYITFTPTGVGTKLGIRP